MVTTFLEKTSVKDKSKYIYILLENAFDNVIYKDVGHLGDFDILSSENICLSCQLCLHDLSKG